MIQYACSSCNNVVQTTENMVNQQEYCPYCRSVNVVPPSIPVAQPVTTPSAPASEINMTPDEKKFLDAQDQLHHEQMKMQVSGPPSATEQQSTAPALSDTHEMQALKDQLQNDDSSSRTGEALQNAADDASTEPRSGSGLVTAVAPPPSENTGAGLETGSALGSGTVSGIIGSMPEVQETSDGQSPAPVPIEKPKSHDQHAKGVPQYGDLNIASWTFISLGAILIVAGVSYGLFQVFEGNAAMGGWILFFGLIAGAAFVAVGSVIRGMREMYQNSFKQLILLGRIYSNTKK